MDVLQIDNLAKAYGKVRALQGVSFAVPKGSIFGILGPNGSGKTTLLSIILDVLKADQGNYSWYGQPATKEMRQQIGSLLETPNFYHYLSATNNLRVTQSISKRGDQTDIDRVLKLVKLYDRRHSRFSSFSLGMKQRLAIAAALLGSPKVLVFDEPTNGLDPVGIAEIRELMKSLHQAGHTIIMASHLLDEVEKVCTHMAILQSGRLLTLGSVDELLSDEDLIEIAATDMNQLQSMAASIPGLVRQLETEGVLHLYFEKGQADPPTVNAYFHSRGITLKHLVYKKKKLETRFFELTNT
jgi:ABC-2 type transport system ATP-binding protein